MTKKIRRIKVCVSVCVYRSRILEGVHTLRRLGYDDSKRGSKTTRGGKLISSSLFWKIQIQIDDRNKSN